MDWQCLQKGKHYRFLLFRNLLREMNFQLGVTVLCLAAAALTARPWIAAAGSNGVSWATATGYGLYFLATLLFVALRLRRREKERET